MAYRISSLKCPVCNQQKTRLGGAIIRKTLSFIVFFINNQKPVIACEDCVAKLRNEAFLITVFLGWWFFPLGLIFTPITIASSLKDKKRIEEINKAVMNRFIKKHISEIVLNMEDDIELFDLVDQHNS